MLHVLINDPPGAMTVPSGIVTSLTYAELSQVEVTGGTVFAAREVGVIVRVRVGLICGSGLRVGIEDGVEMTAAVWAAKTVFAAAVYDAAAPFAGAVPPAPQALSKSAGTRTESAREKCFVMELPPVPVSVETIAASANLLKSTGELVKKL
jgi:hypothetical protein